MRSLAKLALVLAVVAGLVPAWSPAEAADVTLDDAVSATLAHVRAHPSDFEVGAADLADLAVTDAHRSEHSGVSHVYLRQRLKGLDVVDANLTAGVLRDGRVFHTGARLRKGLADSASGRLRLDAVAAVRRAALHLGLPVTGPVTVIEQGEGRSRATVLSSGVSVSPIPARLVYQPVDGGKLRLAWNLTIEEGSQQHWWNVSVDAANGRVLDVHDYVIDEHAEDIAGAVARPAETSTSPELETTEGPGSDGASYRVYALPLESPNDGPRTLATNPAHPDASPHGWHDVDGVPGPEYTRTSGNNVNAYADWSATGVGLLHAEGGEDLNFDFPLDLSQLPHQYKDAAIANLFYWNNVNHDVFHLYGFDEAAGNFQQHNYTGAGVGADAVQADGQDHGGVNNATFGTPPDGSSPRMQMFLWPAGRNVRDGDLDAAVITHEYGHGISIRLTGGPGSVSCLRNEEQGGEGWSDFLGIALTAREGDSGAERRGLGTYLLGQPNRNSAGIRPSPYSTSLFFNPARYDSIKTQAVPHGVGWVWASMLWEVYWALVDVHGFNADPYGDWTTGGNNLALQLVIDGMKLQPCSPGFVDARDAIVAADAALTGGANHCVVWAAFAKRGLGVSADQGSSQSRSDGTQAFDLPAGC